MEVNDETTWAPEVIAYLERHYGLFLGWETRSGATVETPADYDKAICGLREVLNLCDLHGYHCSRLTETEIEHILRNGMQLPNGKMLHDRIMAAHASGLFDATVATRLTSANSADDANRRDRIWFLFFPPHVSGESGIDSLLGLWGGEALYRWHDNDPDIGPILSRTGVPCLVEADVPIASLRQDSFLEMKIARQYLKSRGLQTSEPVDHEDYATSAVPVKNIRRVIRHGEPEFQTLTKCDTWRKPLG